MDGHGSIRSTPRDIGGTTSAVAIADSNGTFGAGGAPDPSTLEAVAKSGRYLGKGLAVLIDILNPKLIVGGRCSMRLRALPILYAFFPWYRKLSLGRNGRLYYYVGGHGRYTGRGNKALMMELDPGTRRKRLPMTFPLDVLVDVPGRGVRDREGL